MRRQRETIAPRHSCFPMPHSDFTVNTLAKHLHLTPQQVVRLADRDKLPGRKVAGEWRFSRAEIHHWMERRIGLSDEEELIAVEDVLDRSAAHGETEIYISQLLPIEAVAIPLAARTAGSVIRSMVDLAARTGSLWDPEKMAEAIRAREEMHPTALENGVALLHPRRPMAAILAGPLITLGRTASGISFGGSGGSLTDVFFLVCSTDDRGHLRTLARLSRLITSPGFLDQLRQSEDAGTVHRLIVETEKNLI
ncbi:MAG: PTS sugar transporter subunit IIA [Pirellulales bacterium]|nr:PTS sugar transporter subunit IIA [Pirellulales bacterium]